VNRAHGLLVVVLVVAAVVIGAEAAPEAERVVVNQIRLNEFPVLRAYVTVSASGTTPMTGLPAETFEAREDGIVAERLGVTPVRAAGDSLAVVLAIDRSGSMKEALGHAVAAAEAFVADMAPDDVVGVIAFDDQVGALLAPTTDRYAAIAALRRISLGRDTALNDAVAAAIRMLGDAKVRRRAVVVLTDGKENRSKTSAENVIRAAREGSIPIHTVALGTDVDTEALNRFATATGGLTFESRKPEGLVALYRRIAVLISSQYAVTFKSPATLDRKWHDVVIVATIGGRRLEGRLGYLATLDGAPDSRVMDNYLARRTRNRWLAIGVAFAIVIASLAIAVAIAMRRRDASRFAGQAASRAQTRI
jgi:VWFA-related protein